MPVFLAALGIEGLADLVPIIWGLLQAAGVAWFGWTMFTSKKSDVQGPNADPTPAQQIAGSTGDIAGGAGSIAKDLGSNSMLYLVGGLAVLLLIGGRK